MKKVYLFVSMIALLAVSAFADGYTVKDVTGKVQYEAAQGTWKNVDENTVLSPSTVINVGLNSKLVLVVDGKNVTIKPMQKGTVDNLVKASGVAAAGLKKGGTTTSSDISTEDGLKSKGVSTASSRASEAKEDMEWDE